MMYIIVEAALDCTAAGHQGALKRRQCKPKSLHDLLADFTMQFCADGNEESEHSQNCSALVAQFV